MSFFRRLFISAAARRDPRLLLHSRTFIDARIRWVRDRALDHAVEKEKHLLPFHSLKDLLLPTSTNPDTNVKTPSLPLSVLSSRRHDLRLPFRAARFVRLFPAALAETLPPPPDPPLPVVSPTPDLVALHEEELRRHSADACDAATRLLRLLMLCPRRRLPLTVVDRFRWDLGLPRDYPRSLLPDYPDFFQIVPSESFPSSLDLELVLYNRDLAVSAMERYARRSGEYRKGTPLAFPVSFPRGFELEKKVRRWFDEWQKLPYLSPYDDASHLDHKSDHLEKWIVGMIHEILSLLVPKKTEKENLEILAQHVGLRLGFKKVISHHPGIFYVSNKLKTQTVVLREAYRRDLLVEKHPLMGLRYQYIHLMHKGREANKNNESRSRVLLDEGKDQKEGNGADDGEEEDEGFVEVSDFDSEDEESDDEDVEDGRKVATNKGDMLPPSYQQSRRKISIEDQLLTSKTSITRARGEASRSRQRRRQERLGA